MYECYNPSFSFAFYGKVFLFIRPYLVGPKQPPDGLKFSFFLSRPFVEDEPSAAFRIPRIKQNICLRIEFLCLLSLTKVLFHDQRRPGSGQVSKVIMLTPLPGFWEVT